MQKIKKFCLENFQIFSTFWKIRDENRAQIACFFGYATKFRAILIKSFISESASIKGEHLRLKLRDHAEFTIAKLKWRDNKRNEFLMSRIAGFSGVQEQHCIKSRNKRGN